ncbi:metal ABC transporter solute-binding protein, Zn/Mn family [Synechococcus sp. PCC 7336]|uniref:metal ABC transporter solute-binding protein, Zn/Mn family n=1 Tax=Synechococcus sp. PCC 7336 TaxID=195250 RepID=UPI00056EC385|nr:zinc ABC transporter substrate-binding protein [Synechococcus sp. PCC 7336]
MNSCRRWGLLLLSCLPLSCGIVATSAREKPAVVTTTSVICDLVRQVAEETVELTCLLAPGQDPHTYEPTPGDRAAIDGADLLLYGGYNLAPDIVQLIEASSRSAPKVAVFEAAVPVPLLVEARNPGEWVADPHVWHSADLGIEIVEAIAEQLIAIAPDEAELLSANAAAVVAELTELHEWIARQVATVPEGDRKLVTTHAAFGYFADAYGLEVVGVLSGLSHEERPSAGRMAALIDWVEGAGIPAIFAETAANRELIEVVARDAGVLVPERSLYVEGPGGPDTPAVTYQQMLAVNTCTIVTGLGGECSMFESPLIDIHAE